MGGGFFKRKFGEAKKELKEEFASRVEASRAGRQAERTERVVQAGKFGKQKAQFDSQQKLKRHKERSKSGPFGGFGGPTQRRPSAALGVGGFLMGGATKSRTTQNPNDALGNMLGISRPAPTTVKRKKKGTTGRSVTIHY